MDELGWLSEYSEAALRSALGIAGGGLDGLPIALTGTNDLTRPTWATGGIPGAGRPAQSGTVSGKPLSGRSASGGEAIGVLSPAWSGCPLVGRVGGRRSGSGMAGFLGGGAGEREPV